MGRLTFFKFLGVLSFFVAGGLVAGVAMADIEIKPYNTGEIYEQENGGGKDKRIVICLVGDVLLASGVGESIAANGPDYPWKDTADVLKESDIAIANLECAVSTRGDPEPDKEYTFRALPRVLDGAVKAGVDVLTLANNHVLDFGQEAMLDTINYIKEKKMLTAGAGLNEDEATLPAIVEIGGKKVAVLAFSRIIPRSSWIAGKEKPGLASGHNYQMMMDRVKATDQEADITVVSMHWGDETEDYPDRKEVQLAHALVDAGADIVVGHHPHVLQGIEFYQGKVIAYSLGNFIFTMASGKAMEGAILQVTDGGGEEGYGARIIPTYINNGTTRILKGADRKMVLDRFAQLCEPFNTTIDTNNGSLQLR